MNKTWSKVRLGEVLKRSDETAEPMADAEYLEITVRLWGKGVVERGAVIGASLTGRRFIAHTGQFIASRIDARNGAMGLVPLTLDGALVTNDFPLFWINRDRLEPSFFGWLCITKGFVELCQRASEGTTNRVRLKEERFLALEIPLPPLTEQRRIVTRIEELAAQINEARSLRQKAVQETKAFKTMAAADCFKCAGERFLLGQSNSCDIVCGQHLNPEDQSDSGIPYITGPVDFNDRIAIPSRYARVGRAIAKAGDVLLTVKGAGVGKVNIAPASSCAIGRQLYAIRPYKEKIDQVFLFYALREGLQHFRDAITATTVPGISRSDVEALELPIPSLHDQRRIVAKLDALEEEVFRIKHLQFQTAAELDALLPAILDRAFKGDLL